MFVSVFRSTAFALVLSLAVLFTCTGCTALFQRTPELITVTPTPPIVLRPLLSRWEMMDLPSFSTKEYSIVIYAMRLTGQDTVLLYSKTALVNDGLVDLTEVVQLGNNVDKISNLVLQGTFGKFDAVEFGFLKFSPRPIGASELFLQINLDPSKTEIIDLPLAQFANPPEDPSIFNIRTYLLGTDQIVEQNGLRITFVGWIAPPSDLKISVAPSSKEPTNAPGRNEGEIGKQATSTPFVITPLATSLPGEGATVDNEATLKIEDNTEQVRYVYMQFLSNGEIVGTIIQ